MEDVNDTMTTRTTRLQPRRMKIMMMMMMMMRMITHKQPMTDGKVAGKAIYKPHQHRSQCGR